MSKIRIKKVRKLVEITAVGTSPMKGYVFLSEICGRHLGPERVFDLLSISEPFFPFEREDGSIVLINRSQVIRIVVDADYELEIIRSYGKGAVLSQDVTISLFDQSETRGLLLIENREGFTRVLDEANRTKGFLILLCENSVHLIGVSFASSVRESQNS